jgi:hypothetical protein
MIAARAIVFILCLLLCVAPVCAAAQTSSQTRTTKALVRHGGANAATEIDVIAPLGRAWGEAELRDFLAALHIEGGEPYVRRGDYTAFRQNKKLGVELTFTYADAMKLRLREYAPDALVLTNIRFYGPRSRTHEAFAGDLPFGLRFGDTLRALTEKLGPPDTNVSDLGVVRWDTQHYALFAVLDDDGTMIRFAVQTPVVASSKPGFEAR